MARFARAVAVGFPYHVTHRGNRREDIFFCDEDRWRYLRLLREYSAANGLEIWAYCLMSNHVHLLAVPARPDALARGVGLTHRRHAQAINTRQKWTGHLWENRFYSTALDEAHLWAAVKYIETNPVRARLAGQAEEYAWSSARAHVLGEADALLSAGRPFPAPDVVGDWGDWLAQGLAEEAVERLRSRTRTGRPCGDASFVTRLETILKRLLAPQKRGPKARAAEAI
jgi:putative transposase